MIDFRYHALSLVAVFLALGIGIVLGVTIGDELVSETDKRLREDLRDDIVQAREEAAEAARLSSLREDALSEAAPVVANGRLRRRRLGLVAIGELPGDVLEAVEESVSLGDGELDSQTTFEVPGELDQLADALGVVFPVTTAGQARRLGRMLGAAVRGGSRPLRRLREALPRHFGGDYSGRLDGVVLYRDPVEESDLDDESLALREAFEQGLSGALRQPVIGVELTGTEPSQVEWYDDHAAASVDNLDMAAGKSALVLALDLGATARFGFKDSADRVLPELSAR